VVGYSLIQPAARLLCVRYCFYGKQRPPDGIEQAGRYSCAMDASTAEIREVPAIAVCHGPRCGAYGGRALLAELQQQGVIAEAVGCQSLCPSSPVVCLVDRCLHRASVESVMAACDEMDGSMQGRGR